MDMDMDFVELTKDKINIDDVSNLVASENCGAISIFVGTTRDNFEGKEVIRLEYESYEPMAIAEIKYICKQIREKWNVEKIAIVHRLGLVPVKEASIVLAISSKHRKESLEAVQFGIDALKATVPIWKKEVYAGQENGAVWKANSECFWNNNLKES